MEFTNYLITRRSYDFFDATIEFLDPENVEIDILPSIFVLTNFLHLLVSLAVIAVCPGECYFICRAGNHSPSTVCVCGFWFSVRLKAVTFIEDYSVKRVCKHISSK